MTTVRCDIALLPEAALRDKAVQVSQSLAPLETFFTLQEATCVPHVSLYMVQIPAAELATAQAAIEAIAQQTTTLSLTAVSYGQSHGYLEVTYQRMPDLEILQKQVLTAINPLRDGMLDGERAALQDASPELRRSLETYGYRGAGAFFRPHLTLTRFTRPDPIDTADLPALEHWNGRFVTLAFFELGRHGTCMKPLAQYQLT